MSTQPPTNFQVERLDDLPLLMEHLKRMEIAKLVDEHIPVHGNWQGLSLGWTVTVWLAHVLSQADHCLSHVQEWVAIHEETLREVTGIESLRELDFTDDRLQEVLRYLNKDVEWTQYERAQGQHLIRVYELPTEVVRLDTTTASTFQAVNPDGILRLGVSKDHRPDLAQLKVMLGTLDPLGLPLATQVVPGNSADDPLYLPAIEQVRTILDRKGVLFVGDSKMSALETRRVIDAGGDYYLTPLSAKVITPKVLDGYLNPMWREENPALATPVYQQGNSGERELIAEGFEITEDIRVEKDGDTHAWKERRLVVRSVGHARAQEASLDERLAKAEEALHDLTQRRRGKKRFTALVEMASAVQEVLERFQVVGLLEATGHEQVTEQTVRGYAGKAERVKRRVTFTVEVQRREEAIQAARRRLGWRVYANNAPAECFSLEKLILVYRAQFIIERDHSRLKGQPLSLTPFHLQREDHITGMVRLLSVALCALTLFDFLFRQALGIAEEPLRGLYPGNPKRATRRPSAELVLRAFRNISRVSLPGAPPILGPLTALQLRVLKLVGFSESIYTRFGAIALTG